MHIFLMYVDVCVCMHTNSQSIRRIGCGPDPHDPPPSDVPNATEAPLVGYF